MRIGGNAYKNILEWSRTRPLWQRDALRRLIKKADLDQTDIDEILFLCKVAHKIEEHDETRVPNPLDETHIAGHQPDPDEPVRMVSISELTNVNAIHSKNPLTFSETGLTVIYGDNGAGKSGYVRVLKNLCRARHKEKEILPNVYAEPTDTPQTAKVEYKKGNTSIPFDWTNGAEPPQGADRGRSLISK